MQFISMHYFHINMKVVDYDQDKKLPFRILDSHPSQKNFNTSTFDSLIFGEVIFIENSAVNYYSKGMSHFSSFAKIVWHPPRVFSHKAV